MTECLTHRGPDGNAVFIGHGVSLGHARLAILDTTPQGNQPMWNESKTIVIVYNGEIYNYRRLREAENLHCNTSTDTEVILKMYEKEGIDCVKKLSGMFAFGLYDTRSRTLHLVRDESGIKPLYVSYVDDKPHFASEMRALMRALPKKPAINLQSLSLFMALQYVPGPETLCEGIESLKPGMILSWKDGAEVRRSFKANTPSIPTMNKEECKQNLPALMKDVVEDHMIADRPIGIFLSGGMDSSILLHHMAQVSKEPVKTFTVRFEATNAEDAPRFNRDADLAKLTAKHYGTDHEELLLTAGDYRSLYRNTACALGQPNADSVSVAQYALARMAKKKVDVVLSGAGGDELFGGYPRYRIDRILSILQCIPVPLRQLGARIFGYPEDVLKMAPGAELALRLLGRPEKENRRIVKGLWFNAESAAELFHQRFDELGKDIGTVRRFMEFDRHLWLVDESLKLCDAVTMASGLEMRVPFLDPRIIAWSHATPGQWHVGLLRTKILLKDAYQNILPEHLYSLKKASFYPPLAKWLRRECAPLMEEALAGKRINEYFDTDALRTIFEEHTTRKHYGLHPLSSVIQLHYWFETVYDG
jgi:asparagine synthase (glutamine-hydrolysing)